MPFLREQPSGVWRICQGSQHHLHRRFCATAARSCTLSTRQAFCCSSLSPLLTLPCLPAPGACHKKNYDNRDTVCRMLKAQNFQITAQGLELPDGISPLKSVPSELVPHCPVCGAPMSMNLRADDTFVEDEGWHMAAGCYEEFLHRRASISCSGSWALGKTRQASSNTPSGALRTRIPRQSLPA